MSRPLVVGDVVYAWQEYDHTGAWGLIMSWDPDLGDAPLLALGPDALGVATGKAMTAAAAEHLAESGHPVRLARFVLEQVLTERHPVDPDAGSITVD